MKDLHTVCSEMAQFRTWKEGKSYCWKYYCVN